MLVNEMLASLVCHFPRSSLCRIFYVFFFDNVSLDIKRQHKTNIKFKRKKVN